MKKLLAIVGGAAVLLVVLAVPASAHVSPSISEAPAGGFVAVTFRIGHGCEGDGGDTGKVEIQMPDGVESATPQAIPGWEARVDDAGPVVVTFEGGPLPHDEYLEFGVSLQMPDTPGETAAFPTIQTCVSGEEIAWIEPTVEGEEEPESPAPTVAITESEGDGHGGTDDEVAEDEGHRDEGTEAAAAATADDDDDGLAALALILGLAGFLFGGYALVSIRRAS